MTGASGASAEFRATTRSSSRSRRIWACRADRRALSRDWRAPAHVACLDGAIPCGPLARRSRARASNASFVRDVVFSRRWAEQGARQSALLQSAARLLTDQAGQVGFAPCEII